MQRLQREGRVTDPGEAVVPVALATRRLGQRRRQGGDRRAGRHVGESLDRERRALDGRAPAVVDGPGAVQPLAPEARGGDKAGICLVDVLGRGEALGPGERAVDLVALVQGVACPGPFTLDAERHVGLQPDRLAGAGGVGCVTAVADERPLGRRAPVVEDRLAHQVDLDAALQAQDGAHEHVVAVLVGRRPGVRRDLVLVIARTHGQRVADQGPAARRVPRRQEGVRAGLVDARRGDVDTERAQPERAGLAIQQCAEDAGRVEARHAEPVDRSIGRDQRAGVAIGEERVVADRREGRGRRGALRGGGLRGLRVPAGAVGLGLRHDTTHGPRQPPTSATRSLAAAGPHDPFS